MKTRSEEAEYAAQTIRNFLDGSCGKYDWDDFNYHPFRNSEVDALRQRAFAVALPVNDEGVKTLVALAEEAERLATASGR